MIRQCHYRWRSERNEAGRKANRRAGGEPLHDDQKQETPIKDDAGGEYLPASKGVRKTKHHMEQQRKPAKYLLNTQKTHHWQTLSGAESETENNRNETKKHKIWEQRKFQQRVKKRRQNIRRKAAPNTHPVDASAGGQIKINSDYTYRNQETVTQSRRPAPA